MASKRIATVSPCIQEALRFAIVVWPPLVGGMSAIGRGDRPRLKKLARDGGAGPCAAGRQVPPAPLEPRPAIASEDVAFAAGVSVAAIAAETGPAPDRATERAQRPKPPAAMMQDGAVAAVDADAAERVVPEVQVAQIMGVAAHAVNDRACHARAPDGAVVEIVAAAVAPAPAAVGRAVRAKAPPPEVREDAHLDYRLGCCCCEGRHSGGIGGFRYESNIPLPARFQVCSRQRSYAASGGRSGPPASA